MKDETIIGRLYKIRGSSPPESGKIYRQNQWFGLVARNFKEAVALAEARIPDLEIHYVEAKSEVSMVDDNIYFNTMT